MKIKYLPIIIILSFTIQLLAKTKTSPVFLNDPRIQAMGGAGIAAATGTFCYIYNPALLALEKQSFTIPAFQLNVEKHYFDIIEYALQNKENFESLQKGSELSAEETDKILQQLKIDAVKLDNIWYRGSTVPYLGMVINRTGIGLYSNVQMGGKIDVGVIVPRMKVYASNDLVYSFAHGRMVSKSLALGVGLKIVRRFKSPIVKFQIENASNLGKILNEAFNEMETGKYGYGIDIGALYRLNRTLSLAAVAQDLLGEIDSQPTPLNFKIGMMYQYNKDLVLAMDILDLFNLNGEKFTNKIHFGGEYLYQALRFRLGFSQGYPTVGLGLHVWAFNWDYTFYTRELANTPGTQGESYHLIGIKFSW